MKPITACNIPAFTIIIPAYNAEKFIDSTLDSVRFQSFTHYDLIVTNDGSHDATERIIGEYCNQHPDLPLELVNQENKGIGGARNSGVKKATGDFIAFLDADDRWYPEKLEKMASFLSRHPHVDVAYHDEIEVQGDGSRRSLAYDNVHEPAYEDLLFRGNRLSTSATVVRRELAQRIGGFSEDMRFNSAEDYEFWLRLARAGACFGHLPEVLGEYHRVEGSVTQKIAYHHGNILNVVEHHLELLRDAGRYSTGVIDRIKRRKRAEHLAELGRAYAGAGDRGLAMKTHLQAINADPFCWKCYTKLLRTLFRC